MKGRPRATGRYDTHEELVYNIVKRKDEGLDLKSIAIRCGCSKGTVQNILKELRQKASDLG